ncbi:hypothetical protein KW785_01880 [Candidatus Parcubacteria bacterium]|nr:hypothetical protein [Candidatus Parcubacteria bacterium]
MISIVRHRDAVWTDLNEPTAEEIREISERYSLAPSVAESLASPSPRHTVEFGENHAYLVLHFPAFEEAKNDAAFELDFIVGKDYLITVHYQEIEALEKFKSSIEAPVLSRQPENARDALFFSLLETMILSFNQKLSKIDHWVRDIEKNMFEGKEKRTIFELSEASRHLIDFKKITAVYPDSLKELALKGKELFGEDFVYFTEEVLEHFNKAKAKLNLLSVAVHELRETNASILSTRQNETMKMLTVATVVATVIVGIALIWLGYLALK